MSSKKKAKARKKKAAEVAKQKAIAANAEEIAVSEDSMQEKESPGDSKKEDSAVEVNEAVKAEKTEEKKEVPSIAEDIIEIKEIVERNPESIKSKQSGKKKENLVVNGIKQWAGKLFSSCATFFGNLQGETRKWCFVSSAVGFGLLIIVIILSVRLGGVSKELKSVQAMSMGLQEELDNVKKEAGDLQLFGKETEIKYVEVVVTPTPTPTPPPTPTPVPPKHVVCVDAGHGGWDGGATTKDENNREIRSEKDDNLWMAQKFRDELAAYGVEVVMTRDTDVFLELEERTNIANEIDADALISFHRNSFDGDKSVGGVEIWIHSSRPKDAQSLAEDMLYAVLNVGGMKNRGIKWGSKTNFKEDFAINRNAKMPSMIVELGFMSNENDNTAYDKYGEAYAKDMAKVVYEWLLVREPLE